MTKKKTEMKPITELNFFVDKLAAIIPTLELRSLESYRFILPKEGDILFQEMKKRHGDVYFKNFINALSKGDKYKSCYHLNKLRKTLKPVSNDFPFEKNDIVSVHRYEHGWDMGYTARINSVGIRNGIYFYNATVIETMDGILNHSEQFSIAIDHTRDAYKIG